MKGKLSSREVPLSAVLRAQIAAYLETVPKDQVYLFQSRQEGKALSRIQAWRAITTAARAAGLKGKIGTHSARKSLARKAYAASGKDLVVTQKVLGHKNVNSTIAYLNLDSETLADVWSKVQR